MWQTKYALAVPIYLGLEFDFQPCSEGDFLTRRPQSVDMKNTVFFFKFTFHRILECRYRMVTKSRISTRLHYAERNFHRFYILRAEYCLILQMDRIEKYLKGFTDQRSVTETSFPIFYHLFMPSNKKKKCRNIGCNLSCLPIRPQVWLKIPTCILSNRPLILIGSCTIVLKSLIFQLSNQIVEQSFF